MINLVRPVTQTRFGKPEGNCLMACIATLLRIQLQDCPDLYDAELKGENYWAVMTDFLRQKGWQPVWMTPEYLGGMKPVHFSVVAGPGPRGADHCCVALNGEIVHDPFPEGGGLLGVNGYIVLIPVTT